MNTVPVEAGIVLGFGGTNARVGNAVEGDISGFTSVSTPDQPGEFFGWMARQVLSAADDGSNWLVGGFPGPVSPDGQLVGPMANVAGLANERYDLVAELAAADPAVRRLLDEDFTLIAVNDGELAAQAAASRVGAHQYDRVAALILGSGVGSGIVDRDSAYANVYRADRRNPLEIGHVVLSADPYDSVENAVSGRALERIYGMDARDLPADHPAWKRVGETAGQLATMLGLMNGVELVVPTGGVGAGASEKYVAHLRRMIEAYGQHCNATQRLLLPAIDLVPSSESQIFEMYGGEGVMRDFSTRGE